MSKNYCNGPPFSTATKLYIDAVEAALVGQHRSHDGDIHDGICHLQCAKCGSEKELRKSIRTMNRMVRDMWFWWVPK
jgi:hypothetical protein